MKKGYERNFDRSINEGLSSELFILIVFHEYMNNLLNYAKTKLN